MGDLPEGVSASLGLGSLDGVPSYMNKQFHGMSLLRPQIRHLNVSTLHITL